MAPSVYSRALQKAAELLGSYDGLARRLGVPAQTLQEWIDGKSLPPVPVFLSIVEFILEETPPPAGTEISEAPAAGTGVRPRALPRGKAPGR